MNISLEQFNQIGEGYLPGLLGIVFLEVEEGRLVSRLVFHRKMES